VRRDNCAACGGELRDFLDLGASPPANRFPATADERETWYPLQVAVCGACWLIQLREVIPGPELYGDDYGFRTGASPAAVRYFGEMARGLLTRYPDQARRRTVEIACNDGTLLEHFAAAGCPALGVDPVQPAAAEAIVRGLDVIAEPFTAVAAAQIRNMSGPAGLVIACNVAAHVADPLDFLAGVRTLLGPGGVAVIEFQDAEKLIAGCQVDHVYHEHRFFYALRSFARMALKAGLTVMDWERTPAQGGSLRVTLTPDRDWAVPLPASNPWLESWEPYAGLQDRALYMKMRLLELIGAERDAGRTVAGYAAPAKAVTLLNWCGLGPDQVQWVEDRTPGKTGRYTPGSHIPVCSPGIRPGDTAHSISRPPPDTYLLFAWNYASDIIRREAEFLAGGGRFIIPGPVPVLL